MHQFHSASHSTWHMILHRALVLLFLPVSLFAFLSLLFGFVGGLGIRISDKRGFGNEDKEVRNTREKKGLSSANSSSASAGEETDSDEVL